ncbi:MAG TPA: tripartite tricarboxylate transporter substrate-binding protein [Candidatus Sulfotelmatobacter sp.]|nr:tripartite tricarboxylate transporter substrate-binding protein [Candidatus Sulfotelmatobacter sp.]
MKRVAYALLFVVLAGAAAAETYPSRPVRLIVPFPAGSGPDQVARVLGQELQQRLGQPFVVEDKSGALGTIGAAEVARAAPDGYTLLVTTNTAGAAAPALVKNVGYDPEKDFAPILRIVTSPMILLVKTDFPASSVKEFVAYARKSGQLTGGYGTAGGQVSLAKLKTMGRFPVVEVPYKGIPPAVMDTISGEVSFTFADFAVGLAQIKGGKLKGLGVTSQQRSPLAPDLPPIGDTLPGFEIILWWGLVAPAGTPRPIIDQLYQASATFMAKPETAAQFAKLGVDPAPLGPDAFAAYIKAEIAKWARDAQEAGLKPE